MKTDYHQQRLAPEDREKTVFVTEDGLHQWNVLPFGLANTPSTFMRTMNNLLEAHKAYVLVYLDDILILTKGSDSEHREAVEAVLRTLHADGWHLNTEKCEWFVDEVHFLDYVVNAEGVRAASSKIDAVAQWPRPRKVREVRSFLEMVGWYSYFIDMFADIAAPLHELTENANSRSAVV